MVDLDGGELNRIHPTNTQILEWKPRKLPAGCLCACVRVVVHDWAKNVEKTEKEGPRQTCPLGLSSHADLEGEDAQEDALQRYENRLVLLRAGVGRRAQ